MCVLFYTTKKKLALLEVCTRLSCKQLYCCVRSVGF